MLRSGSMRGLAQETIPEAAQDVEVGHDLGLRLRPGARYPAGQGCLRGWRDVRGGRGRDRGQLAPDDLAWGVLGGIPVPAGAQRLGVSVPDLDENPGGGAGQVHRYRLAGLAGGVDRVGDELGNEEPGALD